MKIKKGPLAGYKVEFENQSNIERYRDNVDKILWLLAEPMGWDDLNHVFVSDRSTFSDFRLKPEELQKIADALKLEIKPTDYIYEIAMRMEKPQ
jgi:hypothetical protein